MSAITGLPRERWAVIDEAFHALSSSTRRRILIELIIDNPRQDDDFRTVTFLPDAPDEGAMEIELHHNHLPRLDDAGYIEWDRETGRVTRGKNFEEVRPLLQLIDDHRDELPDDWP